MAKKCMKIAAHKRGGKNVKAHVRCIEVVGDNNGDKNPPKGEGTGDGRGIPDFEKNYNEAVKKGHIPQDMNFKEVSEMSGYHSDFGTINNSKFEVTNKGLECTFETDQIFIRSIHSDGKVYIDIVKDKGIGEKGKGRKIIGNIIKHGEKQDIKTIELFAASRLNGEPANGYYTWPRQGLEVKNKSVLLKYNSYDSRFKGIDSLNKLFSTNEGRNYWKREGGFFTDLNLTFSLKEGSENIKFFNENP